MGENTFSYQPGGTARLGDTSASYWRRRCMVLFVGLSLFAMAAWSLSEALQVSHRAAGPARPRHASGHKQPGHKQPGHRPPGGSGAAKVHGPRAARDGTHGHAAGQAGVTQAGHGFGGFKPAFCSRHAIVLSLAAAQISFGPRQPAGFSLSIVSTQRQPCSFNVGSAHLALVVKEGPTRIWSSADCASGTSGLVTALRRGVPTVVTITWHRRTSAPGCTSPVRPVPPGIYTGYAVDGSVTSAAVTFKLN